MSNHETASQEFSGGACTANQGGPVQEVVANKHCGSVRCPHKTPHAPNEWCNPTDVKAYCRWDPTCRCVDAVQYSIASIIGRASPTSTDMAVAGEIVEYLRGRGIYGMDADDSPESHGGMGAPGSDNSLDNREAHTEGKGGTEQ